jgi:hypothetical protein
MEILPCRYLTVNVTTERTLDTPLIPENRRLLKIVWVAVIALDCLMIGSVPTLLGNPPSFRIASGAFYLSAVLLIGAIMFTGHEIDAPFSHRAAIVVSLMFGSLCLLVVGLMWVGVRESEYTRAETHPPPSTTSAQSANLPTGQPSQRPSPPATVTAPPSSSSSSERTDSPATGPGSHDEPLPITLANLAEPFDEHTDIEADALVHRYIGKWMVVEGTVINIRKDDRTGEISVSLMVERDRGLRMAVATMAFSDKYQEEAARALHRPSKAKVLGRIVYITDIGVSLEKSEVISP